MTNPALPDTVQTKFVKTPPMPPQLIAYIVFNTSDFKMEERKIECAQKKMEVAIYHWEYHQVQEYQLAYDIKELSTDKNEKRERKH